MRLHWMALKGFTRFERMVEIDFDAVGPGVIAVVGPNGVGKTSILESSGPGFLYREMPTRNPSSLSASARPEGGRLIVEFSLGDDRYRADLAVDAKGTQSARLERNDEPIVSGKVRDYDAWVEKNLGPSAALYATVYGMQGGGRRFGTLAVRDRKGLFRYYLCLDQIERLHTLSTSRLSALDSTVLRREIVVVEAEGVSRTARDLEATLVRMDEAAKQAEVAVVAARKESEKLASIAAVEALFGQRDALAERLDETERRLSKEKAALVVIKVDEDDPGKDVEDLRQRVQEWTVLQVEAQKGDTRVATAEARAQRCGEALEQAKRDIERARSVPCQELCCPKCNAKISLHGCMYLEDTETVRGLEGKLKAAVKNAREEMWAARKARDEAYGALELASHEGDPTPKLLLVERRIAQRKYQVQEHTRLTAEVARLEKDAISLRRSQDDLTTRLPSERPQQGDLEISKEKLRMVEARHVQAQRDHSSTETSLKAARARTRQLQKELAELQAAAADAEPLRLLARALGHEGIQAFEIDAAGPRVSELTNDLLDACYGSRFSIRVLTQRELKKGGLEEDFAVQVLDAERGSEVDVRSLSGGERVVVDEALGVALSLFANERLTRPFATLWRDEPSAALDPQNQERYLRMLARACELGNFHQALLATHSISIAQGASSCVTVGEDGTVTVERR